jgi:hypothetical protein
MYLMEVQEIENKRKLRAENQFKLMKRDRGVGFLI